MPQKQTAPCRKCKTVHGWYEKRTMSYEQYFTSDGQASHVADSKGFGGGGKRKYCYECGTDITECVESVETQ